MIISLKMEYGNYNALKEKPEELHLLIDKHVKVQLIKKSEFKGFVHSIDPVSYSVILSVPQDITYKTVLIPGNVILDITEVETMVNASPPIRSRLESPKKDASKKDTIKAWLKVNFLPASEDGDTILCGNASLLPPYGATDICTDNPMVAMQMKKIIEAMPEDFQAPES